MIMGRRSAAKPYWPMTFVSKTRDPRPLWTASTTGSAHPTTLRVTEPNYVSVRPLQVGNSVSADTLVRRPGVVASPIGAQPDIVGADLEEVVDQILRVDRDDR